MESAGWKSRSGKKKVITSRCRKQEKERNQIMPEKRLYRSKDSRMLCGVCGGIAEYFNIDPTLIRLLFVLFGLSGSGILVYIIAAIIIPDSPMM